MFNCTQPFTVYGMHTYIKEDQIYLIYKEIQNGAVAKSYMTNGLLIYGEIFAHFLIFWEARPHIWLCNCSTLNFLICEENLIFFFINAHRTARLLTSENIYTSIEDHAFLLSSLLASRKNSAALIRRNLSLPLSTPCFIMSLLVRLRCRNLLGKLWSTHFIL